MTAPIAKRQCVAEQRDQAERATECVTLRTSEMTAEAAADEAWCRKTVPRVMELVSPRLPQRDASAPALRQPLVLLRPRRQTQALGGAYRVARTLPVLSFATSHGDCSQCVVTTD